MNNLGAALTLLGLLVTTAHATNASNSALYATYNNYALDPQALLTSATLSAPSKERCAFMCTLAINCFAVTFFAQSQSCLLLQNCGYVVLNRSNSSVSYVLGTSSKVVRKV